VKGEANVYITLIGFGRDLSERPINRMFQNGLLLLKRSIINAK
jgi:hypothetical protein